MSKDSKKNYVEEMKKNFSSCESVMIAQYQGLNVNELDDLRKQLREKGIAIIGMGKLGSQEMTFTSDLDLIIVYDPKSYENEKSF